MFKISAPIMASTLKRENREKYVSLCREAGVHRVFLCTNSPIFPLDPLLGENIAYFKDAGFEVGIWTDTVGHGVQLTHIESSEDTAKFRPIVNLLGNTVPYTNCPADPEFRAFIAKHIAKLASFGPDIVMLDDDFRMSARGGTELCCACPKHMERICELLGESITVEELRPHVIGGKPNKYRDAWLKAQGEGLMQMAREIRDEVDKESPDVTVCICNTIALWNTDGLDVPALTRMLAGKNKPVTRLTGAPYWAARATAYNLPATVEIARLFASFIENEGFDTMSEGDTYPRPRQACPASYLEIFDAALRADGAYSGILKYMFDYTAGPDMETGYLKMHNDDREFFEFIEKIFAEGETCGVRVISLPHTMADADLDVSYVSASMPRPADGTMISSCGIPTTYRGDGVCRSVFGENARKYELSELWRGTVLDCVSAHILTERGADVGIASCGATVTKRVSFLQTEAEGMKAFVSSGEIRTPEAVELQSSAHVLMTYPEDGENRPLAYTYENARGERFLVFLFDGDSQFRVSEKNPSRIFESYATQNTLLKALPWVARQPLPAYCEKNPHLYMICKKADASLSVALFNCFADYVTNPVITLGESYSEIECFGCEAELDGNKVTLKSRLHGFDFAAFRVFQ